MGMSVSIGSFICNSIKKVYRLQAKKYFRKKAVGKGGEIHFSVDDTILLFQDLTENKERYTSMFDHPTLAYLKTLHEKYRMKVCLYCFYEDLQGFNLSQTTDRFAKEFLENADWLKLGFHGRNCHLLYDAASAEEAAQDYTVLMKELQRICGGSEAITRTIRLSGFQGNREAVLAMRDCSYGIEGLFTADDARKSYYNDTDFSKTEDIIMDGIRYYHTDLRIENCNWNKICLPDDKAKYAIFTHEYYLLSRRMQIRLEKLFCECIKNGRSFSFFEEANSYNS